MSYMNVVEFVDTNVLIYAVSTRRSEAAKRAASRTLLRERSIAVSIQVLQEFYVQATRVGGAAALPHAVVARFISDLVTDSGVTVQPNDLTVMNEALRLRELTGLNYWDCAILAAARQCRCQAVWSEDMSHQQDYDGIRVTNPFANL